MDLVGDQPREGGLQVAEELFGAERVEPFGEAGAVGGELSAGARAGAALRARAGAAGAVGARLRARARARTAGRLGRGGLGRGSGGLSLGDGLGLSRSVNG